MVNWIYGQLDKWSNGKMVNLINGQLAKWSSGKMVNWINSQLAKWSHGKFVAWQLCHVVKHLKNRGKNIKFLFVCLIHPPTTQECPHKISAHLVWPAIGDIYTNVLFYYIDLKMKIAWKEICYDDLKSEGTIEKGKEEVKLTLNVFITKCLRI